MRNPVIAMEGEMFDSATAEVAARLPAGPRLAVIGSTSFWHAESQETCAVLGRLLADLDGLVLVTGGVEGVGETVGRALTDPLVCFLQVEFVLETTVPAA